MYPLLVLLAPVSAEAHSNGQTGLSVVGCTCHGTNADPTTTATFGAAPALVLPGELVPITFTVGSSAAARIAGGLNVSTSGGSLADGSNTKVSSGQITHTRPEGFSGGEVQFDFTWTAPNTDGIYILYAVGNAVNENGSTSGDAWNNAAGLVIEVDNGCEDLDLDGFDTCNGDCNDANADVNPLELEVCDGFDNDCSGAVDDNADDAGVFYPDADLDGFGDDDSFVRACSAPFNHLGTDGDCDDDNASVNPSAAEVCDAGDVDQNCDFLVDDATAIDTIPWFTDDDQDGFGTGAPIFACDPPPGTSLLDGDCDDGNASFNPAASEDCAQAVDLNCDGATGFADNDNDGYPACQECDDGDSSNFPGAFEVCDGEDDDCDSITDEPDAIDAVTWYRDEDGDAHGTTRTGGASTAVACAPPPGFVASSDDCDDDDAAISPDVAEVWYDDVDQNCDGNDDDQDGDGILAGEDCLDTDPAAFPGGVEVPYDGVDGDCAGDDDFDQDRDGHPAAPPLGNGDDCNDADAAIFPGVDDATCDGVDVDCNPEPDTSPLCDPPTEDTGNDPPPPVAEGPAKTGCSCATGGSFGWLVLLLALVPGVRRRR